MNQALRFEIETKLDRLEECSYSELGAELTKLAEFLMGALGEDEAGYVYNTIKDSKATWFSRRDSVVARMRGRLHSDDWSTTPFPASEQTSVSTAAHNSPVNNKVFVVHGHDDAARESVARYLERLRLIPIILHEQVSQSLTVIEKLERHSDVRFSVVLLTPDDLGGKTNEPSNLIPRARQNVLIELGYFVGKLGRSNVCVLRVGNTEIPSDFSGVVYTDMDKAGAWRTKLAQELVSAKFAIDLTALIT